jgi:hypothetical protein
MVAAAVVAVCGFFPANAGAGPIDQLRREALRMERARDCEGAYKKYEEIQVQMGTMRNSRRKRRLLAFVATKMARLRKCYEGCTPSEQEKQYLAQAKQYAEKRQKRRAYRILLRLLRGKNPRCRSWKEAHDLRKTLAGGLKRRRHQKSVDPCDLSETTKQEMTTLGQNIKDLEAKVQVLQQADQPLPAPPAPPRWARKSRRGGYYYRRWLRRWKYRTRRRMRRRRVRYEYKRLMKLQRSFRDIRTMRDRVWKLREEFQNCDQVYTALKDRTTSLKKTEDTAYTSIVTLYKGRVNRMRRYMRYYAGRYRKLKKQQKGDKDTIDSLKTTMQRQQQFIDNVTQDLMLLSNMLVLKPGKTSEGTVLQNSMAQFQDLMNNQQKLFATIKKRFPQFLQTADGRKRLQQQINTLERFEKVLERFVDKQTGAKGEKMKKTLQVVRASIMLLEKADKELAGKPVLPEKSNAPAAASLKTATTPANPNKRNSWGWLFLVIGLGLIGGASFYLWKERQKLPLDS